ncbi:plasmid stabilization protein [Acidiferrobacter sp. SPIII_3]|uniref:type II toxin-antitoxin system RelE/ParE family toxin n=1 Tax=Acidiferrobacter sp. SPIII_3 TaxID=1281578 RepID=UPI000D726AAF|nr:type II toxin-antitoxin system RelE/ParE family toxin [Acidiferrobacter sp. SPIII_3]AWP24514.1 plasmid stabilization protein [Acidiferrobacter sp. SPIII_3]
MSHTVQFSPAARDQLAELEDYLSEAASPAVASRYVDAIIAYCEGLATFPMRGRGRDDILAGLRITIIAYCEGLATFPMRGRGRDDILAGLRITNYRRRAVIAFLVDAEAQIVSIVGVYYGGRDFEAILRGAPEEDRPPDLKDS